MVQRSEGVEFNVGQNFIDFEQPIVDLNAKIEELRLSEDSSDLTIVNEIVKLEEQVKKLTIDIFSNLDAWQIAKIARHPLRPYTLDYISYLFDDFVELHGDRNFSDDDAIVCGLGTLEGFSCVVMGHQKGRTTKENIARNFGMPKPEGYRKALRIMKMAERFDLPILTFIDTPGAYPGVGAEERGQSEAIATNLRSMSGLEVPVVCAVIGEGGSGGALAIGVGNKILMMEFSTYSVISPEGCASILWKDAGAAAQAANAMNITARDLHTLEIIDAVVKEPLGGAHRDFDVAASNLKKEILKCFTELRSMSKAELVLHRRERFNSIGRFVSD